MTLVVSMYLAPPALDSVVSVRHDQAVALWEIDDERRRVTLRRYWELERISGAKHHVAPLFDADEAWAFVGGLLAEEGVALDEVDHFWGTPGMTDVAARPRLALSVDHSRRYMDAIAGLGHDRRFPVHTAAHLYSALLLDWELFREETILCFAVDGAPDRLGMVTPDKFHFVGALSRQGDVTTFPVESPGILYFAASKVLGLEEGSLMALASASDAIAPAAHERANADASAIDYWREGDMAQASRLIEELAQAARRELAALPAFGDARFPDDANVASATMKVVQALTREVMQRNVRRSINEFDLDPTSCHLGLAGGVALNCPVNTSLMNEFAFRSLLTPPAPSDCGQALGLGLVLMAALGKPRTHAFALTHAFHGRDAGPLDEAVERLGDRVECVTPATPEQFADDLTYDVVAWVAGRAEIGPRALGHRSLLGDPRLERTRQRINEVKRRQWWRPVSPTVLESEAAGWFRESRRSPWMLEAFAVEPDRRALIPAVVHLDGSARVQTLSEDVEPALHACIRAFHERTGVPMVCNSSLNDKGEPIVDSVDQALVFCLRRGVGVAYVDGWRVALRAEPAATDLPVPTRRGAAFDDSWAKGRRLWQRWQDETQLGFAELYAYVILWDMRPTLDLASAVDRRRLARATKLALGSRPEIAAAVARLRTRFETRDTDWFDTSALA